MSAKSSGDFWIGVQATNCELKWSVSLLVAHVDLGAVSNEGFNDLLVPPVAGKR